MPRQDVIDALKELDPGQRALLDLSLNRDLSDSLIAGLLENVDESGVAGMRSQALAALARAAHIDGPEAAREIERQLRSASDEHWLGVEKAAGNGHRANGHGNGNGHRNGVVIAAPRAVTADGAGVIAGGPPERPREPRARQTPERPRSSRGAWIASLVVVALVGAIALAVALIGDEGGGDSSAPAGESTQAPAAGTGPATLPADAEPAPEPVALEPLAGSAGPGTVTVAATPGGEGYVLNIEGLPQAYYRLWVYDSLIDSVPVAGRMGNGAVPFEIPADAGFGSLDLSAENGPADRIHSGQSLFRVAVDQLPG